MQANWWWRNVNFLTEWMNDCMLLWFFLLICSISHDLMQESFTQLFWADTRDNRFATVVKKNFFAYYIFQDSQSSLDEVLKEQGDFSSKLGRSQPYILRFQDKLFIVADSSIVVVKPSTLAVAVDTLLKSFFFFNVSYPRHTSVVHHLFQHCVVDIKANLSAKANKLYREVDGLDSD